MEILAGRNVHVADERYVPADETDLPDVLLAWRDAAVQAALAAQLVAPGGGEFPGTPGMVWSELAGGA